LGVCSGRHFSREELQDHHTGACDMDPRFVELLDRWREATGKPLSLFDAYRSPSTNKAVGGARHSYHLIGLAADPRTHYPVRDVVRLGLFSGIGVRGGFVVHVDARHLAPSGPFASSATQRHPLIFPD
jgi:uncharacterized protein YcbK (DUF882 family)